MLRRAAASVLPVRALDAENTFVAFRDQCTKVMFWNTHVLNACTMEYINMKRIRSLNTYTHVDTAENETSEVFQKVHVWVPTAVPRVRKEVQKEMIEALHAESAEGFAIESLIFTSEWLKSLTPAWS